MDRAPLQSLDGYFAAPGSRPRQEAYFYRIAGCSGAVRAFLARYCEEARRTGVVIEGHIPSPDAGNLSYYDGVLGKEFQMDGGFFRASLAKWLPRMEPPQAGAVADAILSCLEALRAAGKSEGILKNTYVKFMCWLYYRFEPVVRRLGGAEAPKVLFDGDVTAHELYFLSVLSQAGCDVVLLERGGDAAYLRVDAASRYSDLWQEEGLAPFPPDFSLAPSRPAPAQPAPSRPAPAAQAAPAPAQPRPASGVPRQQLYGQPPSLSPCTNAWLSGGDVFADLRTPPDRRGDDARFFYNCFVRVRGVESKAAYVNALYTLYQELKAAGRRVAVADGSIPAPAPQEIAAVRRQGAYRDVPQMVHDLGAANVQYPAVPELQRIMMKAFVDVLMDEAEAAGNVPVSRLTNRAVYLVCWLKRYMGDLFQGWRPGAAGVFFHMGPCSGANDALFLRFLSRLPVDVVVLVPDAAAPCQLADAALFEKAYPESMAAPRFPREASDVQAGTAAFHAERELDTLMYQDTGMYRNQQYAKANALILQTMCEEVPILWKSEIKYRPNFGTAGGVVNVPVLFSKISGVKDGNRRAYWDGIRGMVAADPDALVITRAPYIAPGAPNPMKQAAPSFLKNGRLQRDKIKAHPDYPYGFLREEVQEHILDKLQLLVDQKLIKGMGENGTEYTAVATVLNLDRGIARMMQKFDFTKTTPKLLFVLAGEQQMSLEDAVMVAFLDLAGFDVVFYVPTGYQAAERYFSRKMIEEHQAGEYLYDMQVPDLKAPQAAGALKALRDTFFKRR